MAVLKFSQISTTGSNLTSSDFLLAVQGGTADVLFTPAQVFAFANLVYASNILEQRNSTNAQTLRVYNTFTDASNYERGVFDWTTTANVLSIGTQALGTGTLRPTRIIGPYLESLVSNGTYFRVSGATANDWLKVGIGSTGSSIAFGSNGVGEHFHLTGDSTGSSGPTVLCWGQSAVLQWASSDRSDFGGDTGLSRGGAAGVIAIGNASAGDSSGTIKAKTKAGAIVAGDIPSGTWALCRDTSGATTKLIYNNAGTLMTVALT